MYEGKRYTDTQIDILMMLMDEKGHAQWEISERTKIATSNLSDIIKQMRIHNIVCEGRPRKTTRPGSKRPNVKEIPLYINRDLDAYRTICNNIHDKFDENILNVTDAKANAEANKKLFSVEKNKLCYGTKGKWTRQDILKLEKKITKKMLFKGHTVSFYEENRDKFVDHLEKFISSPYTEKIIKKFGFDPIVRMNIVGTLDIWHRETLLKVALEEGLITEEEFNHYCEVLYK